MGQKKENEGKVVKLEDRGAPARTNWNTMDESLALGLTPHLVSTLVLQNAHTMSFGASPAEEGWDRVAQLCEAQSANGTCRLFTVGSPEGFGDEGTYVVNLVVGDVSMLGWYDHEGGEWGCPWQATQLYAAMEDFHRACSLLNTQWP